MAGKFELYKDASGSYRFRLKASNGQVIAVGEAYESKASALNGIESVRKNAGDAASGRPDGLTPCTRPLGTAPLTSMTSWPRSTTSSIPTGLPPAQYRATRCTGSSAEARVLAHTGSSTPRSASEHS